MRAVKQIVLTLLVGLPIIAGLGFIKYLQISAAIAQGKKMQPPPAAVTTLRAEESEWQETLHAIGTVYPSQGVMVRSEEPGKIVRIAFESGDKVKEGELLVELDTSVEEAQLRGAQAKVSYSKQELERERSLRTRAVNSAAELEASLAEARGAEAEVEALKAKIAKKRITAPFNGRTGIRQANLGQYVTAGFELVPLHALNPVFVDFSLPQQHLGEIAVGQRVRISADAYQGLELIGAITAINPEVDETTRNVKIRATVSNPEERLRPGMYTRVEVVLPKTSRFIALPATSISYAPYGDTVYVVEKMKPQDGGEEYLGVRQQIVKLGQKRGDQVAVLEGLAPGTEVVTSGTFKLRPMAPVQINNDSAKPANDANPTPADT